MLHRQFIQWSKAAPCWTEQKWRIAQYAAVRLPTKSCWCSSWCCSSWPSSLGTWWLWLWFLGLNTSTHRRVTWRRPSLWLTWQWGFLWYRCPFMLKSTSWRLIQRQNGHHTTHSWWVYTHATLLGPSSPDVHWCPSQPFSCWQLSGASRCWGHCIGIQWSRRRGQWSSLCSPGWRVSSWPYLRWFSAVKLHWSTIPAAGCAITLWGQSRARPGTSSFCSRRLTSLSWVEPWSSTSFHCPASGNTRSAGNTWPRPNARPPPIPRSQTSKRPKQLGHWPWHSRPRSPLSLSLWLGMFWGTNGATFPFLPSGFWPATVAGMSSFTVWGIRSSEFARTSSSCRSRKEIWNPPKKPSGNKRLRICQTFDPQPLCDVSACSVQCSCSFKCDLQAQVFTSHLSY